MRGFNLIIKPDNEDADATEVLVDGTIGDKPYRFLLDTGAARTCIQFDEYTSTLFAYTEPSNSSGVFAKRNSTEELITVPSIELGPITQRNFPVVRVAEERPDVKNLIGMDLLKNHRCHFFFDEHHVTIDANDEFSVGSSLHDLFLDTTFHPYIDVHFGTLTAHAVWDTGAGITIADMQFIRTYPALFEEVGRSRGTDATGTTMDTSMFIMAAPIIGTRTFPPHKVAGVDLSFVNATIEVPMDLILGYSTLSKANWLFDFPRKKWGILNLLKT